MNQYKAARVAAPMTQAHLAEAAGIDERTLRKLENGEKVSAETVLAVRAVLKMDDPAAQAAKRPPYSGRFISRTEKRTGFPLDPLDAFDDDKMGKLACLVVLTPVVILSALSCLAGLFQIASSGMSTSSAMVVALAAPILAAALLVGRRLECCQFNDTYAIPVFSLKTPPEVAGRAEEIWKAMPEGWDGRVVRDMSYGDIHVYKVEIGASKRWRPWVDGGWKSFNDAVHSVIPPAPPPTYDLPRAA